MVPESTVSLSSMLRDSGGSSERDHQCCAHLLVDDAMSAGALAGILVGLFFGGFIGALAIALVAAGSQRRSSNSEARSLE